MATIVDSLVVQLRLDTTQFKKEADGAGKVLDGFSDRTTKLGLNIQQTGQDMGDTFKELRNQALGFLAVLTGGRAMKEFAAYTTQTADSAGLLARSIGISTQELTAWQQAVKQAGGGTAEEAAGAISNLAMEFEKLKLGGQSNLAPFFNFLHVGLTNASGGFKSMTEMLIEASAQLSKMTPARANLLMSQYGNLPPGMRNLLLQGPDAVRAAIDQQKQSGVVTEQQAENARRLNAAMTGLYITVESLTREVLDKLTPSIVEFAKFTTEVINGLRKLLGVYTAEPGTVPAKEGLGVGLPTETWPPAMRRRFGLPDQPAGTSPSGAPTADPSISPQGVPNGAAPPLPAPTGPASSHARAAYDYFVAQGWSPSQAAGLVGHLSGESGRGLNPNSFNAAGGGQGARGIGQWRGERIDNFRRLYGHDPLDPNIPEDQRFREQVAFVHWELTQGGERGAGMLIRGASTAGEAADIALRRYGRGEPNLPSRAPLGEYYSREFQGSRAATAPPIDPALLGSGTLGATAGNVSNQTSTTNVGSITVNTQARDPAAVAQEVRRSLSSAAPAVANTAYGAR